MNIGNIDHRPACGSQMRRGSLRQKQRRFEVAAEQVIPRRQIDLAKRRRKKTRRIIHQRIKPPKTGDCCRDQQRQLRNIEQIGLLAGRGIRAERIELGDQRFGISGRRTVMQHDIGARRMYLARDRTADPLCRPGNQNRLAIHDIHSQLLNFRMHNTRSWILTVFCGRCPKKRLCQPFATG